MPFPELDAVFAADGVLAQNIPSYVPRQAQQELAHAIGANMRAGSVLIAEAGTGTGKTWAYLVPAFLAAEKTLISTGTRTLQDQLFKRDIPRLRQALGLANQVALLKGRSNYVCHYHLERLEHDSHGLRSRAEIAQLRKIKEFTRLSDSGDKADLPSVPETADIWQRVTSTRENCLGQDCPFIRECFLYKARRKAQDADVVVVNHALFMADLALREEGCNDLLPQTTMVVFDEAHQLPDTATRFLGQSVSLHQILDCAREIELAGQAHARETDWGALVLALQTAAREFRLAGAAIAQMQGARATFENIPDAEQFDAALAKLYASLQTTLEALAIHAERHPDINAAHLSAQSIQARISAWMQPARGQAQDEAQASVRWVEYGTSSVRLQRAPLSVAQIFAGFRKPEQAWLLTSATLSLKGSFQHFQAQLGLEQAQAKRWESPFDYQQQALLYVPHALPLPSQRGFIEAFVESLLPALDCCPGGALVLCTTLRAVDQVAELLQTHALLDGRSIMRQGESSRSALLANFSAAKRAILVGSTSFWEGVDLPGQALTLVAIDKLPFAPPDDPVLEARIKLCKARGGNPFMEFQLPQAALLLKQGAGRLIRSESDWGVLVVGDGRLVDKPYGRILWQGLPPFERTRVAPRVLEFMRAKTTPAA